LNSAATAKRARRVDFEISKLQLPAFDLVSFLSNA
jgi:thiamine kinase-like enzyme